VSTSIEAYHLKKFETKKICHLIQLDKSFHEARSIHERQMNIAAIKIHRYGFIHPE